MLFIIYDTLFWNLTMSVKALASIAWLLLGIQTKLHFISKKLKFVKYFKGYLACMDLMIKVQG